MVSKQQFYNVALSLQLFWTYLPNIKHRHVDEQLLYCVTIGNRSLTFVLDLTFDLTFCRLFSFFLLRAFFPLKVYGDSSVLQIKQFTLKK